MAARCMLGIAVLVALTALLGARRVYSVAEPGARHSNNWAVLVSTSRAWLNYRHIVNTFSIYHVVKRLGIPDTNIILMVPDDMACNPRNPLPARLFNNESHQLDVYGQDVEVDYRGHEVTAANLLRVLTGRHAPDVPRSQRLLSDKGSNVLVYLSGHGGDEFIKFNGVEELLAQDLADAVDTMAEKGRYRELMVVVETCQAATLVQRITAPNVITLACSQKGEQSLSYKSDPVVGLSLIDRFTARTLSFFERLQPNSTATLQDVLSTYSFDYLLSNHAYRMTNASRRPSDVLLTHFFGSVASTFTQSERAPQDHMLHGDNVAARSYSGYLKLDAAWDLEYDVLERPYEVHQEALAAQGTQDGNLQCAASLAAGVPWWAHLARSGSMLVLAALALACVSLVG